jgi:preprotein translocase subunit YajC
MNFLYAAQPAANQPSLVASLLPLIILFVIFYLLVILPQQRQAKKHKEMVESLKKGDKIVTIGGVFAEVIKNEENFLKVKVAPNVEIKIDKSAVARKVEDEQ